MRNVRLSAVEAFERHILLNIKNKMYP